MSIGQPVAYDTTSGLFSEVTSSTTGATLLTSSIDGSGESTANCNGIEFLFSFSCLKIKKCHSLYCFNYFFICETHFIVYY